MHHDIMYTLLKYCYLIICCEYFTHLSQFQGLKNISFFQILLFLTPSFPFHGTRNTSTVGKKQPFLPFYVFSYTSIYPPLNTIQVCPPGDRDQVHVVVSLSMKDLYEQDHRSGSI